MRTAIFVISIFSYLGLSAQTNKNFLLRTNLGYNFSHVDAADAGYYDFGNSVYGEKINDFAYNISAGKKFQTNFYYGVGLLYNITKQEINPDSDIPMNITSAAFTINYNNSVYMDNTISPFIFIQYFNNITDRFSVAFDLYSKYDFSESSLNRTSYIINVTNHNVINDGESHSEIKKEYLSFGILPSLRFTIIKNFGMDFTFGIMEYRLKTKDSRLDNPENQSKEFKIGFKPENWLIGFYLKL